MKKSATKVPNLKGVAPGYAPPGNPKGNTSRGRQTDWAKRTAKVPLPDKRPGQCELCPEPVEPGQAVRWNATKNKAVHDTCARKLVHNPGLAEPLPKGKRPKKPKHPMTLERWPKEPERAHRGFLLWAMQHDTRRNQRCVARAMATTESNVRYYMKQYFWVSRIADLPRADNAAVEMYRNLYHGQYGPTELPEVAAHVLVPLGIDGDLPPDSEVVSGIKAADSFVREEIYRKRREEKSLRAKHTEFIDVGIEYVIAEMTSKRLRATLRDLPVLMQARALVTGEAGDSPVAGGQVAFRSMRIQQAQQQGTGLLEAMAEDVAELAVIIGALQARSDDAAALELGDELLEANGTSQPALRVVSEDE